MIKTDALIIGAGPTGLFTAHQLKLIGLDCEIVDNLDKIGGQCIELYPDKPIYDIPAVPECTGEELTNNLINQIKPFNIKTHLGERVDKVHQLAKSGKINLYTKYQLTKVIGDDNLESVEIKHDSKEIKTIKTDFALGFFGLIMQLGPIADWGLNIDKKTVNVDTEKFETNQKGIYAVGDICSYPGKLKLILSGFHEGALAARACFKLARPNEKYRFEFTTSSKTIKDRLGVKSD